MEFRSVLRHGPLATRPPKATGRTSATPLTQEAESLPEVEAALRGKRTEYRQLDLSEPAFDTIYNAEQAGALIEAGADFVMQPVTTAKVT